MSFRVCYGARGDTSVSSTLAGQVNPLSVIKVQKPTSGWSRGDSNPGPPPCKGGALPAKLRPPSRSRARPPFRVGAPGLEPGTSALSGPRSNHLSYAPVCLAGISSSCVGLSYTQSQIMCRRRSKTQLHCDVHMSTSGSTYHERPCQAVRHSVTTTSSEPVPR